MGLTKLMILTIIIIKVIIMIHNNIVVECTAYTHDDVWKRWV